MKIELTVTDMSPEQMATLTIALKMLRGDYDREDATALMVFAKGAMAQLLDADIFHSNSAFSMSSIRAAFDNDIKPLFGSESQTA